MDTFSTQTIFQPSPQKHRPYPYALPDCHTSAGFLLNSDDAVAIAGQAQQFYKILARICFTKVAIFCCMRLAMIFSAGARFALISCVDLETTIWRF